MDADDIMVSDRLQAQYEYMEAHPETDILGGHMHCFNAGEYDCILPAGTDITMPQMLEQCYVANPTSFIRQVKLGVAPPCPTVAKHLRRRLQPVVGCPVGRIAYPQSGQDCGALPFQS